MTQGGVGPSDDKQCGICHGGDRQSEVLGHLGSRSAFAEPIESDDRVLGSRKCAPADRHPGLDPHHWHVGQPVSPATHGFVEVFAAHHRNHLDIDIQGCQHLGGIECKSNFGSTRSQHHIDVAGFGAARYVARYRAAVAEGVDPAAVLGTAAALTR